MHFLWFALAMRSVLAHFIVEQKVFQWSCHVFFLHGVHCKSTSATERETDELTCTATTSKKIIYINSARVPLELDNDAGSKYNQQPTKQHFYHENIQHQARRTHSVLRTVEAVRKHYQESLHKDTFLSLLCSFFRRLSSAYEIQYARTTPKLQKIYKCTGALQTFKAKICNTPGSRYHTTWKN